MPKDTAHSYSEVLTEDGSLTLYSKEYDENYHSLFGAYEESLHKFVIPSKIKEISEQKPTRILDLCFGLGYNCFTTLDHCNSSYPITIHSIEKDLIIIKKTQQLVYPNQDWKGKFGDIAKNNCCSYKNGNIFLHLGEARAIVSDLAERFDVIYLDPFSTTKNSELWTYHFFKLLKTKLTANGVIVTYSSALAVRSGLLRAGFYVYETKAVGRKRGGTLASLIEKSDGIPLAEQDKYLIQFSKGAIPYRDPKLNFPHTKIIAQREKLASYLIKKGKLMTINHCKKMKTREN